MKGIRDEFGQILADQDFKFVFDEDVKGVTITVAVWSCLALNPWMVDMLESDTFGRFTTTLRHCDVEKGLRTVLVAFGKRVR